MVCRAGGRGMKKRKKKILLAEFNRLPSYEMLKLSDIKIDEGRKVDEYLVRLYQNYYSGKLGSLLTRVDIRRVHPGVFLRNSDGEVGQFEATVDQRYVEAEAYRIRCGHRPSLTLYKGIFGDTIDGFVCSDDVLSYQAYRLVGINYVPAIILGRPKKMLEESAICLLAKNGNIQFNGTLALPRRKVGSLIGSSEVIGALGPLKAVRKLRSTVSKVGEVVRQFHIKSEDQNIYYHHCLYSVVYRISEALSAIELLLRARMEYQIRPIVRSTYELFLNFYLDWLSPEKVGPVMQGAAVLARTGRKHHGHQELTESMHRAFGGLVDLCRNAADKGRLSPLGHELHDRIYSGLSPAVHQDFGVAHEYGAALEKGRPEKLSKSELLEIVRWLDIIVTATVVRLLDDVGGWPGKTPPVRVG
jgi:hypothetical protein